MRFYESGLVKIYSDVEEGLLIHMIVRGDFNAGRLDISPEKEFLQLAKLNMNKGKTFAPHKHVFKKGEDRVIAQESWVVIRGEVRIVLYDIDDKIIHTDILYPGDCSVTFQGGHNYEVLEDDTLVYEYKTGPYKGQKLDKAFI